jgi:hypothetical protein
MSQLSFDRPPAAVPLDRKTLLARFDGIRQFARGGRRAPNKPLLLLYALARLKHDRQAEIRFNTTEAILQPLLGSYGPCTAEDMLIEDASQSRYILATRASITPRRCLL